MSLTGLNVANKFLEYSFRENIGITNNQLQKLIYILYVEYLKKTDFRMLSESFEATEQGPILPCVCCYFQNYKNNFIDVYAKNSDSSITLLHLEPNTYIYEIFLLVWNKYKYYTDYELSTLVMNYSISWKKSLEEGTNILKDEYMITENAYI